MRPYAHCRAGVYLRVRVCENEASCIHAYLRVRAYGRCTCHKVIKRPLLEPQPLRASRRTSQFRQENARHNDEIYAAPQDRRRSS